MIDQERLERLRDNFAWLLDSEPDEIAAGTSVGHGQICLDLDQAERLLRKYNLVKP